jgi:hypothetical protein
VTLDSRQGSGGSSRSMLPARRGMWDAAVAQCALHAGEACWPAVCWDMCFAGVLDVPSREGLVVFEPLCYCQQQAANS